MTHIKGKRKPGSNVARDPRDFCKNIRGFQVRPAAEVPLSAQWNWRDLPVDHPERIRIEAMFDRAKPISRRDISTLADDVHKQKRRRQQV